MCRPGQNRHDEFAGSPLTPRQKTSGARPIELRLLLHFEAGFAF
jgi:hypothetical protein